MLWWALYPRNAYIGLLGDNITNYIQEDIMQQSKEKRTILRGSIKQETICGLNGHINNLLVGVGSHFIALYRPTEYAVARP
jgi:hypothetical protein